MILKIGCLVSVLYLGQFENNLDACVYWYNEEVDPKSNNPIRDYIEKHGLKILDKYKKYVENNNNDIYD
jgi:hypothetical protein